MPVSGPGSFPQCSTPSTRVEVLLESWETGRHDSAPAGYKCVCQLAGESAVVHGPLLPVGAGHLDRADACGTAALRGPHALVSHGAHVFQRGRSAQAAALWHAQLLCAAPCISANASHMYQPPSIATRKRQQGCDELAVAAHVHEQVFRLLLALRRYDIQEPVDVYQEFATKAGKEKSTIIILLFFNSLI